VSSLLLRVVLFVPLAAEADYNSQNMPLLTSNLAMISDKEEMMAGVNIVSDNAMVPAVGALGVSNGTDPLPDLLPENSVYVVRKGDSLSQIAEMYGVSANTVLWANDMKKGDKISEGDVLVILPVSGVEHSVTKGQTLQSIAKLYKADAGDIALFNEIAIDSSLNIGDKLLIPDGEMMDEGGDRPTANLKATETKDIKYYATSFLKNLVGYFINPVPTGHKTQGLHGPGMRGIDIGAPTGTNLYASASGVVIATKTGCTVGYSRCGGGYGNMVQIQHPNGTKTLYGHMSKVFVPMGTKVERGDVIGLVGNTGHSTGPHVHFEVFNAKNPGASWSWAK
jgi:LysM repeat protein